MIFRKGRPVSVSDPIKLSKKLVIDCEPTYPFTMVSKEHVYWLCRFIDVAREKDIVLDTLILLPRDSRRLKKAEVQITICASMKGDTCVNLYDYEPKPGYYPLICLGINDYEMTDRDKRLNVMAGLLMHEIGHIVGHLSYQDTIYSDENKYTSSHDMWKLKNERFADEFSLEFFDDLDVYKDVMTRVYREREKSEHVDRSEELRNRSTQFDRSWQPLVQRFSKAYGLSELTQAI